MAYDLVVRGGTVVDGSGLPGYVADVGISDGRIAAIGDLKGQAAKQTLDAEGHVVSPGFIDGHTHMDAQVFWDQLGTNGCWHGVTSVVMGNCGFSLAPCAEKDKALVFSNLERAEEISPKAMEVGIPWSWTTFGEYLDAIEKLPKGLNYAGYVGHSALRAFVMGQRAMTDAATPDDLAAMTQELDASIRAGAIGLSTSRSHNHRMADGRPVASRVGDWSEVEALVDVMGKLGAGVFEISRPLSPRDPVKGGEERQRLKNLAVQTGVPITFGSAWYHRETPDVWRPQFDMVDETFAAGGKMLIQGSATWHCSMRSFETFTPYDRLPKWSEFRKLPLAEQEKGLRNPEVRKMLTDAVRSHVHKPDPKLPNALQRDVDWTWFFPYLNPLPPHRSIAEIAREQGKDPLDCFLDLALERHLKLFFIDPGNNQDQDYVKAMIRHPNTAVTFTDAGAHVGTTLNPVQTYLLGHWVRQEEALTLEAAVRKITFDLAAFWQLGGRGLLREGYHADICVFDPKTIRPQIPTLTYDLPDGGARLLQKADGIKATVVNGEVLVRDNQGTEARPGVVMRGPLASNDRGGRR
jgi:N-acyl-D-aspartate/D-glutamate deacylase